MRVAFVGQAGSGKSTLANYLETEYDCICLSFASPLKEIAQRYFGMTSKDRTLLQQIGTKMREIDPKVWINLLLKRANNFNNVVVDDCRFINEAFALREKGFTVIKITGRAMPLTEEQRSHVSEKEQDDIFTEYTIDNSGTLEESITQLEEILEHVKIIQEKVNEAMEKLKCL
jgi:dephospho-CoA kinase